MGTSDDSAKKNRLYRTRWSGLRVCVPLAISRISRDTLTHVTFSSICVITILRIVFAVQFNYDDVTYDYSKISITTVLEPVLGILVACLPMFPPVFKGCVGREGVEQDSEMMRLSDATTRPRFPDGISPVTGTFPDSMTHTLLQTKRRGQDGEDRFTGSDSRASFHRHWT